MDINHSHYSKQDHDIHIVELEACSIYDKIILFDRPRSVFFMKGKIRSCPVGGRLESRYMGHNNSLFIGTYDSRANLSMIIEDLHLAVRRGTG